MRLLASIAVLFSSSVVFADGYPSGPGPCDTTEACEAECTGGKMASCTWGGFLVLQSPFDMQAHQRARVMFEAACVKGDTESCWQAARLEETLLHRGGGDADAAGKAKVTAAYVRACKKQHVRGCVNAGYWTADGGDAKAKAAGLALYKKAATIAAQRCEKKKDALICGWLSNFWADGYFLPKDEKKSEKYRQRACKLTTNRPCDPM
ncbi:MAG: hypothetical protein AB7T06_19975 [Kofleriaceae bacterium]